MLLAADLFNKDLVDAISDDNKITVLESHSYYGSAYEYQIKKKGIVFYFNEFGMVEGVWNPTMIKPSFDCTKAKSRSTKKICSDLRLANQDQEFASKYAEGERYLTGNEFTGLEKWRLWFVGNREECDGDVVCLSKIIGNGISALDSFIQEELAKADPVQDFLKSSSYDGNWVSEKYVDSASCGSGSHWEEMEKSHFSVDIKYPNIFVTKIGVNGRLAFACKVSAVQSTTYAKVYFNTVYQNTYWGSCGGSIEKIPYSGNYTFVTLKPIDGTEGECGTMVLSGRNGDNKFILWGGDPIDKQLVDSGYILKRK